MARLILPASALVLLGIGMLMAQQTPAPSPPLPDVAKPALETAFDSVMAVITHPRCMNCHPADDRPRQGEAQHLHRFGVRRGEDGHGVAALRCQSCHQTENNPYAGVPGAPHWHLAPLSMGWQGLSPAQIARAMLDPAKNGGRTLAQIKHHLTEDQLVLWAFEPGINHEGQPRAKPPISQQAWVSAVRKWIDSGAPIPAE